MPTTNSPRKESTKTNENLPKADRKTTESPREKLKSKPVEGTSGKEPETDPAIQLRPQTKKKNKLSRLSLKTKKQKSRHVKSERLGYTQNYTEDGMLPTQQHRASTSIVQGNRKPVQDAFPGITLHIIKTEEEKMNTLKALQKQIELKRLELEKLLASENQAKQAVQILEQKEEELLKSCEKIEEVSAITSSPVVKERKLKGKEVTPLVPEYTVMDIDLRDVQVCELLGTGKSGTSVYLVNVGGWCCAMKELPRHISNEINSEIFEKEMELLYQMPNHPNLARYLFHKKLRGRYCLFMSRYSGTLREEIDQRKKNNYDHFPIRTIIKLGHEIANGLTFLHSQQIIHRNLKSNNIFIIVNRQGDIRDVAIADFDQAKWLNLSPTRPKSIVGTPGFMAPEVLNASEDNPYTIAADIFSFGMVLYELMTLEYPYFEYNSPADIAVAVTEGKELSLTPKVMQLYTYILDLWKSCISKDPTERPQAAEVREKFLEIRAELDKNRYRRVTESDSEKKMEPSEKFDTNTEDSVSEVVSATTSSS